MIKDKTKSELIDYVYDLVSENEILKHKLNKLYKKQPKKKIIKQNYLSLKYWISLFKKTKKTKRKMRKTSYDELNQV